MRSSDTRHPIAPAIPARIRDGEVWEAALGCEQYRTTEASWLEAGEPSATVRMHRDGARVRVAITVHLNRAPRFARAVPENPLDNEPADINSDGVQLHWEWSASPGRTSVLAVPDGVGVRTTVTEGHAANWSVSWSPAADGYAVEFQLEAPSADATLALDCCVNEMPAGRERRRGQLVLSGRTGDRAYLRGPRQPADRALHFAFSPVPS